jgi:hypothetical protein
MDEIVVFSLPLTLADSLRLVKVVTSDTGVVLDDSRYKTLRCATNGRAKRGEKGKEPV